MPPKYAIQWGSVWHKSRLRFRDFYRKSGIRTPKIWHTKPPLLCHMNRFYWGWGWSLICWELTDDEDHRTIINSVQTRCIVKGEAQKSPLFWQFSGGFWFSEERLFCKNSTRNPLNLIKSPIFTNAPCKSTCLYNAPSVHTVEIITAVEVLEQM